MPDAVNRAHKISVCRGVCGLFEFPKIFRKPGDRGRRIKDYLGTVKAQTPRAFGKMAVIADINPDPSKSSVKTRITEIAGPEIELFPEAGSDMRNMVLAVFA